MRFESKDSIDNLRATEYLSIIINLSERIFHDLKNSLATILGVLQLVPTDELPSECKYYMEQIQVAGLECKEQLDRFHSFIEGYDEDVDRCEVFNDIVFAALNMIKYRLIRNGERNVILNVNIHSLACVYCNEYKMRQAILNILINALDAMEESGGVLEVGVYEQDNRIVLDIIDMGIGISDEDMEKIFQPNYTTKGSKGTGLGLKVSKSIFEEYGGKIEVKSRLGEGTKFTITFPISTSPNEPSGSSI